LSEDFTRTTFIHVYLWFIHVYPRMS